jgi:multidrug efflux pump subunit AcrB
MDRLRQYFIEDRMVATLIFIILIILGILSLWKMPNQMIRRADPARLALLITAPGFANKDVETTITEIEDNLKNLPNISFIYSDSKQNGGMITLNFEVGTDLQKTTDIIKDRISNVKLPKGVDPIQIKRMPPPLTIAKLLITGNLSRQKLTLLTKQLVDNLNALKVGDIKTQGLTRKKIIAEISPLQLYQLQTSYHTLAEQLKANVRTQPIGSTGADETTQSVISSPKHQSSPHELTIHAGRNNQAYILKDIANIKEVISNNGARITYNGQPATVIHILLNPDLKGSMTTEGEKVQAWVNLKNTTNKGIYTIIPFDEKWLFMKNKIKDLTVSIVISIIVISLILMIFISWNITFWIVIGMITCILGAFGIYGFTGGASINMISIFGLIMAIGIIVDDSIVVGEESYYLWNSLKFDPLKANMAASRKPSILTSSATTIIAFAPLFTVPGNIGIIFFDIPLIMTLIILVSIIECLLIMPHHLYKSFKKSEGKGQFKLEAYIRHKCTPLKNAFSYFAQHVYKKVIDASIDYRWITITLVIVFSVCCFGLLVNKHLKVDLLDNPHGNALVLNVNLRNFHTKNDINNLTNIVEKTLHSSLEHTPINPNDVMLISTVSSSKVDYRIQFPSKVLSKLDYYEFMETFKKHFKIPSYAKDISLSIVAAQRLRLYSAEILLYNTNIKKDTYSNLANATRVVTNYLKTIPGILTIHNTIQPSKNNLEISLTDKARQLGLNAASVSHQLRSGLYGSTITTLDKGTHHEREFILKMPEEDRKNIHRLEMTPIITPTRSIVTLGQIATISESPGYEVLFHANHRKASKISINLNAHITSPGNIYNNIVNTLGEQLKQRYQVTIAKTGDLAQSGGVFSDLTNKLIISVILIYFILIFMFKSWVYPLLILPTIVIALAGAILGLWILGINFSAAAFFGLFGLAGVVVNDAIILIMCFRILVNKEKLSPDAAIKQAVFSRSRAILLTSITTIVAIIPAILNTPSKSDFLLPLSIAMVFGMAIVTFLLLFFTPALISVYISWKLKVREWLGRNTQEIHL